MGIWLHDALKAAYPQYKFGYVESDIKKCCDFVKYKAAYGNNLNIEQPYNPNYK